MGVDRTDYLMVGVDMGADGFDWGKHQAEIEGSPERRFDIVYDGMCGQYCIAGKVIAVSDAYEGFEMSKIDTARLDVDKAGLAASISESFGAHVNVDDFSLVLFSHYS